MDIYATTGFDLRILDLRILEYLLRFCDIFDEVWSLLKYLEKCELEFTINLNFASRFLTFYFI